MTYQEINSNFSIENLPNEIFKDIPEYEGLYQVSNLGRVKSLKRYYVTKDKILKPKIDKDGYLEVALLKNKKHTFFKLHRLVMLTFKGYSDLQVNHKEGNKQDNRFEKLEYCTCKENIIHSYKIGIAKVDYNRLQIMSENNKRKVKQFTKQKLFIKEYDSILEASIQTKISKNSIGSCCRKEKHYNTAGGYIWEFSNV